MRELMGCCFLLFLGIGLGRASYVASHSSDRVTWAWRAPLGLVAWVCIWWAIGLAFSTLAFGRQSMATGGCLAVLLSFLIPILLTLAVALFFGFGW